ncbi:MAG: glutathione peroxidase [Pseudomonadota bacterium]
MMDSIFDFDVTLNNGEQMSLSDQKDKVTLIVNTASKCGFTPQYKGLEALHQKFKEKGVAVIGFPCNQFGGQEPGSNEDISQFCEMNFGVTFPLSEKIDVNGDDAHPLFTFLKAEKPGLLGSERIKWNFTKFLVNQEGQVVKRYPPTTKPEDIESEIEKLLA